MLNLRVAYYIGGFATGLVLLFNFLASLPDGKLHIVFCNVGQGDAVYIRFPDGRDMLVDGGPGAKVLDCLGRRMPFWDRSIDIVLLTHPESDHLRGLLAVLERYHVGVFVRSDARNNTEEYRRLSALVKERNVRERFVVRGERIAIGDVHVDVVWPPDEHRAKIDHLNNSSVVFWLRYGLYDALFTGDKDMTSDQALSPIGAPDHTVELLKVPHHGSKTGMKQEILEVLRPTFAIISVGKNSYGHPAGEVLTMLADIGTRVLRTDDGEKEMISDGRSWVWR